MTPRDWTARAREIARKTAPHGAMPVWDETVVRIAAALAEAYEAGRSDAIEPWRAAVLAILSRADRLDPATRDTLLKAAEWFRENGEKTDDR